MRRPFALAATITAAHWRIKSREEGTEAKRFMNARKRQIRFAPHLANSTHCSNSASVMNETSSFLSLSSGR